MTYSAKKSATTWVLDLRRASSSAALVILWTFSEDSGMGERSEKMALREV
ncbi:hypothetical protein IMZ48_04270 [Candidatus Bathyarchaeota archaeon]|nr:hypothetical protein [Candidatus Bathyarchaeota archaeon]